MRQSKSPSILPKAVLSHFRDAELYNFVKDNGLVGFELWQVHSPPACDMFLHVFDISVKLHFFCSKVKVRFGRNWSR